MSEILIINDAKEITDHIPFVFEYSNSNKIQIIDFETGKYFVIDQEKKKMNFVSLKGNINNTGIFWVYFNLLQKQKKLCQKL